MKGEKSVLCRIGFHNKYHYMPKVGGYLGEDAVACKRCGYGVTFDGGWDISPESVQDGINNQAEIEYGRVIGFYRGLESLDAMEAAYNFIKDKFTTKELEPILRQLNDMKQWAKP